MSSRDDDKPELDDALGDRADACDGGKRVLKTRPFDAARYIDSAEDQAELLSEILETGDPRAAVHVLGTIARARGMTDLASITGVSRSSLYAAISDDADPSIDMLMKVVDGLKRAATEERNGPFRDGDPG